MKFFFIGPLIFIASLCVFTFSYNLNHVRHVFLSLSKSTFISAIYVEEESFTPRFNYQKTNLVVDDFFKYNMAINQNYRYSIVFIDLDTNNEVFDHSANQIQINLTANLLLNYQYDETLIVSLEANHA